MTQAQTKNYLPDAQNPHPLAWLLFGLAVLMVLQAAMWLTLPPAARDLGSMSHSLAYAAGAALLGVVGLRRGLPFVSSAINSLLRRYAMNFAGAALFSIPVLACLGSWLNLDLLPLPLLMSTPFFLLIAVLVTPEK